MFKFIFLILIFLLYITPNSSEVLADNVKIDVKKIIIIESSNNPLAHNKRDNSRGIMQITPILLKEWNNFHKNEQYSMSDLWDPYINKKIGIWYLEVRIPQMLRYYNKPATLENILISYNAGISYVAYSKKIPKITRKYIKKYNSL